MLAIGGGLTLLAACVPPPSSSPPNNLSLDMRRMQSEVSRQKQQIDDLSQRLSAAEELLQQQELHISRLQNQSAQPTRHTATAYYPSTAEGSAQADDPAMTQSPTEVYLQAFGDYASGRYQVAIQGFQTFLQRFPNNSYASNAQYWLADSYFNQQQYNIAIPEYQKVLDDYPRAPKSPDALLKMAAAHSQLGNSGEAQLIIDTLKRRYPESTAAHKADELNQP